MENEVNEIKKMLMQKSSAANIEGDDSWKTNDPEEHVAMLPRQIPKERDFIN